ncbi:MAG: hypothetical protein ACRC5M_04535 [Anaeroplasmataceae bacterium]
MVESECGYSDSVTYERTLVDYQIKFNKDGDFNKVLSLLKDDDGNLNEIGELTMLALETLGFKIQFPVGTVNTLIVEY